MSPLREASIKRGQPKREHQGGNAPLRMHQLSEVKVAVIGLGYVGLPLAAEFGKLRSVVGFDINQARIDALENGYDATLEVSPMNYGKPRACVSPDVSATSLSAMSSSSRCPPRSTSTSAQTSRR